jgi:hypothetical protein
MGEKEKNTTWFEQLVTDNKEIHNYSWDFKSSMSFQETAFQKQCRMLWGAGMYYHGESLGKHHTKVLKARDPVVVGEWKLIEKKFESGRDVKYKTYNQKIEG